MTASGGAVARYGCSSLPRASGVSGMGLNSPGLKPGSFLSRSLRAKARCYSGLTDFLRLRLPGFGLSDEAGEERA